MSEPIPDSDHPRDAPWELQPGRPWRLFAQICFALLAVDLCLVAVPETRDPTLAIDGRDDVRRVLQRARDNHSWVLIGDSVLAGDVLKGRVENWQHERVLDHLRTDAGAGASSFEQVAVNGVVLGDVIGVIDELDRVDPEGRVRVVIEVNPRYFSEHTTDRCAREWLCARSEAQRGLLGVGDALDGVEPWIPVLRHRRAKFPDLDLLGAVWPPTDRELTNDPEGQARILAHYRSAGRANPRANKLLKELQAKLERRSRTAVFFSTPLNDAFLGEVAPPEVLGKLSSRVARVVNHGESRLVELDHPLFRPEHFVDHCHLWPDGNDLLAKNLLIELGEPLRDVPLHGEIAHPIAPDRTLVGTPERGFADGPGWVARFQGPTGLALGPEGQLVVADTGNALLRVIAPPLQTTRTLAGSLREHTDRDGPIAEATLDHPTLPAFVGEDLYFLTRGGRTLRRLRDGVVDTVSEFAPGVAEPVQGLKSTGGRLVELHGQRALWLFDPATGERKRVLGTRGSRRIVAFEPVDERLYAADESGRILELALRPGGMELTDAAVAPPAARVRFANAGTRPDPAFVDKNHRPLFPRAFDADHIGTVTGLHWVDRYEGLLVRYQELPQGTGRALGRDHWRLFDLERQQITPWVRPRPYGGSHTMWELRTETYVSPHFGGDVVIDPDTASVYHLERGRSRLVWQRDGILGAAQISHATTQWDFAGVQELYGDRMARMTNAAYQPAQYLGQTGDPNALKGPYTMLVVGSSMWSMSDLVGQYGLGRVLEERLRERLGYRDHTGLEVFVRILPSGDFPGVVDLAEEAARDVHPDVIVVGMFELTRGASLEAKQRDVDAGIDRLLALQRTWNADVLVVDTGTLVRLRATPAAAAAAHPRFEAAGIPVLSLGPLYMQDNLDATPWANPPFGAVHMTPWAIDATAERLATAMYPRLRDFLRDRTPSWSVDPAEVVPVVDGLGSVRPALAALDTSGLPKVGAADATVSRKGERLEILLDVAGRKRRDADAGFDELALAAVLSVVKVDRSTDTVRTVRVRVAHFSRYDEYGEGATEGAQILFERELDAPGLAAWAKDLSTPAASP